MLEKIHKTGEGTHPQKLLWFINLIALYIKPAPIWACAHEHGCDLFFLFLTVPIRTAELPNGPTRLLEVFMSIKAALSLKRHARSAADTSAAAF